MMSQTSRLLVEFKFISPISELREVESGFYTIEQFLKRLNDVKVHNIEVWCLKDE